MNNDNAMVDRLSREVVNASKGLEQAMHAWQAAELNARHAGMAFSRAMEVMVNAQMALVGEVNSPTAKVVRNA